MTPSQMARRMWTLAEPVHDVTYFSAEARAAFEAAGLRGFWRGYFAGRSAPLGTVAAAPVAASFYVFAPAMVGRALPAVWDLASPEQALRAREAGAVAALSRMLAGLEDRVRPAADNLAAALAGLDCSGRVLAGANSALPVPGEPVARLWHAATLLREHRGDGHNAALLTHGIGGTEAHVLMALSLGMRAEEFGRLHHLPKARLAAVLEVLRGRGLVDAAGGFTDAGRATRERIEALTDELAAPAYDALSAGELDELIAGLEPIAAVVEAANE